MTSHLQPRERPISGVITETATVYRGGGRRWFSRSAAIRAEASKLFREHVKARCECDEPEYGDFGQPVYPGNTCHFHDTETRFRERFVRRVGRLIAAQPEQGATQ